MSDWDDLFAAAAGETTRTEDNEPTRTLDDQQFGKTESSSTAYTSQRSNHNNERKRKKRKKDRKQHNNDASTLLYQSFLQSRLDPIKNQIACFPSWLQLGPSLCTKQESTYFCSEYTPDLSSSDDDNDKKCTQCKMSPLYHSSICCDADNFDILNHFALIRDIRCCCSCIFDMMMCCDVESKKNQDIESKTSIVMEYVRVSKLKCKKLLGKDSKNNYCNGRNSLESLPLGERKILQDKFQNIHISTEKLYNVIQNFQCHNISQYDNTCNELNPITKDSLFLDSGLFDALVRLLMAADAAYYRMYYLQVAGYFKVLGKNTEDIIYLPHPTTYFGVNNLTWNITKGKQWVNEYFNQIHQLTFKQKIDDNEMMSPLNSIINVLGFYQSEDNEYIATSCEEHKLDPLSFLHQNRFIEGLLLFGKSQWTLSSHAYKLIAALRPQKINVKSKITSIDTFYKMHEAIAPPVLEEWRDSCRDFLCHLYGYATLHPATVVSIKEKIRSLHNIQRLVEMGSGTGYLARILNNQGLEIDAYDIAPTSVSLNNDQNAFNVNEYHGSTPPFYNVKSGDVKLFRSLSKQHLQGLQTSALLLCYPPPQNNMADEMLLAFKSAGGKCVIHVGEFDGLTGSKKFQDLLKTNFDLISRYDALHWGNDSAEVTIWYAKRKNKCRNALLHPCSNCQIKDSIKQCKLLRTLRYCCFECYDAHCYVRSGLFALYNIPLWSSMERQNYISFQNPDHFRNIL